MLFQASLIINSVIKFSLNNQSDYSIHLCYNAFDITNVGIKHLYFVA